MVYGLVCGILVGGFQPLFIYSSHQFRYYARFQIEGAAVHETARRGIFAHTYLYIVKWIQPPRVWRKVRACERVREESWS